MEPNPDNLPPWPTEQYNYFRYLAAERRAQREAEARKQKDDEVTA